MGVSGTNMAAWSGRQRLGALSIVGDPVARRDLGWLWSDRFRGCCERGGPGAELNINQARIRTPSIHTIVLQGEAAAALLAASSFWRDDEKSSPLQRLNHEGGGRTS